jgi:DNA-binding transcriptional LysR family regulator
VGGTAARPGLALGFVTGSTPDRWAGRWRERYPGEPLELVPVSEAEQETILRDGALDAALVREPVDRTGLHLVRLYEERPVVVVPADHVLTAYDEVALADLADEQHVLPPPPGLELREPQPTFPRMTQREAVEVVASGAGVAVMPMSVARLYGRKDVTHRPVTGTEPTNVGLAWLVDRDDEQLQRLVGVVRGRTARSSRG